MPGHVEVQDLSAVMTDHEKAIEQTKCDAGHCKEVHRSNRFSMIPKESHPPFCSLWISWRPSHPAGNGTFTHIESKHQQFPVNSWRSPRRIIGHHVKYQIADFFRDALSPDHATCPRDRAPVELESSTMPGSGRIGKDEEKLLFPVRPKPTQQNPEQLIERRDVWSRMLLLKNSELLA